MKSKLPPIAIIVGVILLIGGLIFVLNHLTKESFSKSVSKSLGLDEDSYTSGDFKDSDQDGLRDWEEELYGTDPFNPDTDGDGFVDGEETNSGHNPLVRGPGDELTFHPLPLGEKYNFTNKILNQETIQEIFLSYLSQKVNYLNEHPEINNPEQFLAQVDSSVIQDLAEKSIEDSYNSLMGMNEQYLTELSEIFDVSITNDQINISNNNSREAIQSYVSEISEWLNSDVFFLQNEALEIVANAFKNQSLDHLQRLITLNDKWVEQMKKIAVPSSWKEIHKQGLKIIILTRNIFVSFRDYQADPLKALYATGKLETLSGNWTNLIKQAIDLAEKQGIELPL